MEDVEEPGAEMATDSPSAPKANEDVDAASCPTFSATSLPKSNETTTKHPPMDQDAVGAVLTAQERTQRGETEVTHGFVDFVDTNKNIK